MTVKIRYKIRGLRGTSKLCGATCVTTSSSSSPSVFVSGVGPSAERIFFPLEHPQALVHQGGDKTHPVTQLGVCNFCGWGSLVCLGLAWESRFLFFFMLGWLRPV